MRVWRKPVSHILMDSILPMQNLSRIVAKQCLQSLQSLCGRRMI